MTTPSAPLIMGPSGSGKTTLLLMLGAMLRPSTGSIIIDDTDLAAASERHLPRLRATHLGFVFQDFNLLGALTVVENVELAANLDSGHGHGLDIGRLLRRLASEDGRSVLIVSHDERLKDIADRILWLEDGTFRELDTMATDPVCGMSVPADRHATIHLQRNGETRWFCSTAAGTTTPPTSPEEHKR